MSSIINAGTSGINITGSSSTVLSLATNGTTRVNIDASGNMGVGTTTASFKITNNFDAPATWGNNANNFIEMWQNSGTNALGVAMGDDSLVSMTTNNGYSLLLATSGIERMRIDTSGNVGINKVPTTTLDVSGTVSDISGNVRNIPSAGSTKVTAYTLAVTDIGEFVTVGASGSITVPNNTFATGNAISVYNDTTGNVSINISTTTAYVVGTNTNRTGVTLATRGIANILFINPSYCILSGNLT